MKQISTKVIDKCYKCGVEIEEYCYAPTVYYKDGQAVSSEDLITGMTEQDKIDYENDEKNEDESVDYVEFGEYCPHCLACM